QDHGGRLLRAVPRAGRRVRVEDLLLDDADQEVPGRPGRHLRGLLGVDPGVDGDQGVTAVQETPVRRFSAFLYRHGRVRLAGLLSVPMLWLVVLYLGSLAVMVISSFWSVDDFTGDLVKQPTGANYQTLIDVSVYRTVALRTLAVAVGVTLVDVVIGLPI